MSTLNQIVFDNSKLKTSGIYKITSSIHPDRYYIGSSVNIRKRWWAHKYHLRKNMHHSPILQNYVNKYGIECMIFEVIEFCSKADLQIREQYYLTELKPILNSFPTVTVPHGCKCSEETKRKISEKNKGKPSHNKGKPSPLLGSHHTDETKKKISTANKGKIVTQETRDKISAGHIGKKMPNGVGRECGLKLAKWRKENSPIMTEETKNKIAKSQPSRKAIYQLSLTGEIIAEFYSISEASKKMGRGKTAINNALKGLSKTAFGYIWKYKEDITCQ